MKLCIAATDWVFGTMTISQLKAMRNEMVFNLRDVTFLAPIPRPGKVICIAGNYPTTKTANRPEYPTVFLKPSGGVIGDQQRIVIPRGVENVACEVELAVVIGERGRNLPPQEACSIIAGYTIANDLGDGLLEKRTSQWTSGKMFDTFTPMGPVMITPDEVDDTSNLDIFSRVNDRVIQKGNTSQMFFDVPQLVSYISTLTTLDPGDVILTGSPKLMEGEPNPNVTIRPGDCVQVGIETIATLTNPVIAEKEVL
jgi:2-keto-4-pentenoate hydratase/2-oxohepta-3-ene-1,7-dioic acid hydratase in catechol pathway